MSMEYWLEIHLKLSKNDDARRSITLSFIMSVMSYSHTCKLDPRNQMSILMMMISMIYDGDES